MIPILRKTTLSVLLISSWGDQLIKNCFIIDWKTYSVSACIYPFYKKDQYEFLSVWQQTY